MTIVLSKGVPGFKKKSPLYGLLVSNTRSVFYGADGSYEELLYDKLRSYEKTFMRDCIYNNFAELLINKSSATFNYNDVLNEFCSRQSQYITGDLKYFKDFPIDRKVVYIGFELPNNDLFIVNVSLSEIESDFVSCDDKTSIWEVSCKSGLNRVSLEFRQPKELKLFLSRLLKISENNNRYVCYIPVSKVLNLYSYGNDYRISFAGHIQ